MSKAGKEIITGAEHALAYLKGDKTKGRAYTGSTEKDAMTDKEKVIFENGSDEFIRSDRNLSTGYMEG